jgi:hypothetical protein
MKLKGFLIASAVALVVYIVSVSAALAAPLEQGQTPVPPDPRYPTVTPRSGTPGTGLSVTPTLIPPPDGGGRVAVDVLYIRENSSFGSTLLGSLLYNQVVFPRGRSADGRWIAIDWNGRLGWVFASLVAWDENLDIDALPVFDDLASGTALPLTPALVKETATVNPPTATAVPATQSPEVVSTPTVLPTNTPLIAPSSPDIAQFTPSAAPAWLLWLSGGMLVFVAGYLIRRWQGHREFVRYENGFPAKVCPACGEGHLLLEETTRSTLGVMRTKRSVRCDNCRSVLREVRPGIWRYTVDPMANPSMAQRYSTEHLKLTDIQKLSNQRAMMKSTRSDLSDSPGDQVADADGEPSVDEYPQE